MSLLLSEIRLTPDQDESELEGVVAGLMKVPLSEIQSLRIIRKAIDARHSVRIVYQVEIVCRDEDDLYHKLKGGSDFSIRKADAPLAPPTFVPRRFHKRPVVVGFGPAGIFASLILAQAGADPIVLEQGGAMEERVRDVEAFWSKGIFRPESNVCFGEGGAGTFSDGKLLTRKRAQEIPWLFQQLVEAGAPSEILYESRPHIGTDRLRKVVVALGKKIESCGGEIRFHSRMTDLLVADGAVCGVQVNGSEEIPAEVVILSPGHGAGETFRDLLRLGVPMEPKPLAMGVRVEHPQRLIDTAQYGRWAGHERLGPADYRLTYRDRVGSRGVYSFCMCPGGRVISANSEAGSLVTNGMSTYGRNSGYANSGLVVTIDRGDFGDPKPLSGLAFLQKIETEAFRMGGENYFAPAQRVPDFLRNRVSSALPHVTYRPGVVASNLNRLLPDYVSRGLQRALSAWGRKMPGFVSEEAVLVGLETRTSSPVRILRNRDFSSVGLRGLYPVGEGAGYAGGIVSSALDGIQCAYSVVKAKGMDRNESKV